MGRASLDEEGEPRAAVPPHADGEMRSSGLNSARSSPARRLDLRGLLILVVEDHDDSRDMLRQMVEAFGATVMTARDGREAMSLVSQGRPDLVLLDLLMPGM